MLALYTSSYGEYLVIYDDDETQSSCSRSTLRCDDVSFLRNVTQHTLKGFTERQLFTLLLLRF